MRGLTDIYQHGHSHTGRACQASQDGQGRWWFRSQNAFNEGWRIVHSWGRWHLPRTRITPKLQHWRLLRNKARLPHDR